jgi:hypothetical protein
MEAIVARLALKIGHCMSFDAQNRVADGAWFYSIKLFINISFPQQQSFENITVLVV